MALILLLSILLPQVLQASEIAGAHLFERQVYRLFTIQRSLNKNLLVYEARATPEGFSEKEPIYVYWLMNEKSGEAEPLTKIEKAWAYGVSVKEVNGEEVVFSLKALPSREIRVRRDYHGGQERVRAILPISGQTCELKEVYIQTEGKGLVPTVLFTELKGISLKDGLVVTERIEGE